MIRLPWALPLDLVTGTNAMAIDDLIEKYGPVRRGDRAADDTWIRGFLHQAPFGVLATVDNGQPFMTPNTFLYDEAAHAIYLHTAASGRMRGNIEGHDRVCFCAAEMGRLLPADTALEFSVEYASVVVFGRAAVVAVEAEAKRALQSLLDKYFPHLQSGRDYRAIVRAELERTAVFRVDIEHWSGKQKREADDFPGAFTFTHRK